MRPDRGLIRNDSANFVLQSKGVCAARWDVASSEGRSVSQGARVRDVWSQLPTGKHRKRWSERASAARSLRQGARSGGFRLFLDEPRWAVDIQRADPLGKEEEAPARSGWL